MSEEMFVDVLPDGRTWRCVKSQLYKTKGKSPIPGSKRKIQSMVDECASEAV